jgi:prepilin-type processing-associated H-X9-DG protein/prepilin-type N-terminal cleavage/methylation domain-containing protein
VKPNVPTLQRGLHRANGFSLVELLTVIAVLGILAALILAALSQAKKKADQTHCISNLRQLGIALQGFVTDYHVYPPQFVPLEHRAEHPEYRSSWEYALEATELSGKTVPLDGHFDLSKTPGPNEWVGRENETPAMLNSWGGVWHCPGAFPPPANFPAHVVGQSYGYNANGLAMTGTPLGLGGLAHTRGGASPISIPAVPASSVISPSDMMAIGDRFLGNNGVVSETGGLARDPTLSETNTWNGYARCTQHAYARHNGKANVVFCDGHAESPTFKTLFDDTTEASLRRWNRDHEAHPELLGGNF